MNNQRTIPYPYLPNGRQILYVPADNQFIIEARKVRDTESTDFMNPTGAVIARDGHIIARAANKAKLKNPKLIALHSKFCLRRLFRVPSGKGYFLCPGCADYKQHAESRVIAEAIKNGQSTKDADLFLFGHWWCCEPCWNAMIKAQIKNIYLIEQAWELFKRKAIK